MKFIIHKHFADKAGLHYDLRIQVGNKLYSFACRKGIPLKKGIKHLLIKQPDHDLSWLNFEGEIKDGYGKGKIEVWDKGDYESDDDLENLNRKKVVTLYFNGKKVKGKYVLVKIQSKDSWIIFKA